jgi:hypothetical protein
MVKGVYMRTGRLILRLALAMATTALAYAQQYDAESDFSVMRTDDGKEVIITGYSGIKQVVSIPPQIRQLPVTTIRGSAFSEKNLTGVTIPDSITSIGSGAFSNNQLTSVTIGNGVTSIGREAFNNNQLASVTIPDSVTEIGESAFEDNRLSSVTIGNGVTKIGESAFESNRLASVTIPNKVTNIGISAFQRNQLASVTIPDSVTEIGAHAFRYNKVTRITIGSNFGNKSYVRLHYVFDDNGFASFYYGAARQQAGTYVYGNGSWGEDW